MNEWMLIKELENKGESLTDKAINSRVSRARRAERILQEDLDCIVSNDDRMYSALIALKNSSEEHNGNIQNALRWYYRAIRGTEFPKLNEYRQKRPNVQSATISRNSDITIQTTPFHQPQTFQTEKSRQYEPIGSLWKEYCIAKNRITDALGRSNNVVGELAERIVADFHNVEPFNVSHPSADVGLKDGTLIQVKARMLTGSRTTQLSTFRSWNFDILAVILFDIDGSIIFGGEISQEAARKHAREVPHVNGWQITTTQDFLLDPNFIDLTKSYQTTLDNL